MKDSYLSAASGDWLEEELGDSSDKSTSALADDYALRSRAWFVQGGIQGAGVSGAGVSGELAVRAFSWIDAYRRYGYSQAGLNPLKNVHPYAHAIHVDSARFNLQGSDVVPTFGVLEVGMAPVAEIQKRLAEIYHGSIGIEIDHIRNHEETSWLTAQMESSFSVDTDCKRRIFTKLLYAELLERHLHNNFVGQKRFSLEGCETLIPLLDFLAIQSNNLDVDEIIFGMAHRGRLNVLINIMGKTPSQLFDEFAGKFESLGVNGDVKYHLGFSSTLTLNRGSTHLVLGFNPSHLEIISPVVLGSARARQDRYPDDDRWKILPITIHGDAAFSGQGVVMESLNMSQTRGFSTQGTIHIIINNQIGFTIDHPRDARSTPYCSDPARFIDAPIIHVNGDDPEAAIRAGKIALKYRQKYRKNIVIDLIGYRRHGHNEADDPLLTQPIMYQEIKKHPTVVALYHKKLLTTNSFTEDDLDKVKSICKSNIENGRTTVAGIEYITDNNSVRLKSWSRFLTASDALMFEPFKNNVSEEELKALGTDLATVPGSFATHPQIKKLNANRLKMAQGELLCDWGFAENLSYATLLKEGYGIRLTGQDVKRGTFAHRHTVTRDQKTNEEYYILKQFRQKTRLINIYDSLLSEEAVLAFEYGYSTAEPDTLTIWEAQFGDFANGAQVVIDQFISSGEAKWGRKSGLVMLLPHGFEGQGPEHSSARLERFLQLCAQNNMSVVSPTTPAQIYHLLRRQLLRGTRKPTVVMSPKSLLRHPKAVSSLEELANGYFETIIDDASIANREKVKQLIFCSGKIYYQLMEERANLAYDDNSAIIRIEQIYPFPKKEYRAIIDSYPNRTDVVWCQEEPMNQGAWYHIRHRLNEHLLVTGLPLRCAGRSTSASPAVGLASIHKEEQQHVVSTAFKPSQKEEDKHYD